MSKVKFELMRWPGGLGLNICSQDGEFAYSLSGTHGGGKGEVIKRFQVDVKDLEKYIEEYKYD